VCALKTQTNLKSKKKPQRSLKKTKTLIETQKNLVRNMFIKPDGHLNLTRIRC
jgi:hypothetical protein